VRVLLSFLLLFGVFHAESIGGVPENPTVKKAPNPSLFKHSLDWKAGPLDNPVKGLVPYRGQGTGYPRSVEFSYIKLSDLNTGWNQFDWGDLEWELNDVAKRGNQLMFRPYVTWGEYSDQGMPGYLRGDVDVREGNADWNDPEMLKAAEQFIVALAEKYDGDPRIAYIEAGLVGYWGEWHTYKNESLMPTPENCRKIISWYDSCFNKTEISVRYAYLGINPDDLYNIEKPEGWLNTKDIGLHDDSFIYKGYTLPESMGGFDYSFLTQAVKVGGENSWMHAPNMGEVRPNYWDNMFNYQSDNSVDNPWDCLELSHNIILRIDNDFNDNSDEKKNWIRKMGYDFHVSNAYYSDKVNGGATIGVEIENRGVSPFYYKWPVKLAFRQNGNIKKEWEIDWDITTIMPKTIKTFPDWGLAEVEIEFGGSTYFETNLDVENFSDGRYELLLRIKNPLEDRQSNAKYIRFSNAEQNDKWLHLGNIEVDRSFDQTGIERNQSKSLSVQNGFLTYQVSSESQLSVPVKIDMYSIMGKHITTLVNTKQRSGIHKIPVHNYLKLIPAKYIYKISMGKHTPVQVMLP